MSKSEPFEVISVRVLLERSTSELWELLPPRFAILYDNQKQELTTKNATLFSSYYWDVIRHYPNIEVTVKHHLDTHTAHKPYSATSHQDILNVIYKDVAIAYGLNTPLSRDELDQLVFQVNNNAYNELTTRLYPYMTSIDILDFIEVTDNPEIVKLTQEAHDEKSIKELSDKVPMVMKTDPALDNNRLALAVRNKIVKEEQIVQCVAMRGYTTDVDSTLFAAYPVTHGYVNGLETIYESLVESRLGAKALLFSEEPLRKSEYLSRRIQLLAMGLERIHYMDCGSTEYFDYYMEPDEHDDYGNVIKQSPIQSFEGKYYLDSSGKLAVMTGREKHLIGKWVKFRTMRKCLHPDPHGCCAVCFGELSQNIQPGANVGHLSGSVLGQIISQLILSTKHHEKSKSVRYIRLDATRKFYFNTDIKMDKYYLSENVIKGDYYLEIANADIPDMNDIIDIPNLTYSDIARNTKIKNISLYNTKEYITLDVQVDNMTGYLTSDFIQYLRNKGWSINVKGNYVIDISEWDYRRPFIVLDKKEYNNYELTKQLEAIVAGKAGAAKKRSTEAEADGQLRELIRLLAVRLNVNVAILEVIMYGATGIDPYNYDCRPPKGNTTQGLGVLRNTMAARSLSGVFAHEDTAKQLIMPAAYFPLFRDNYIMDVYIEPHKFLKARGLLK